MFLLFRAITYAALFIGFLLVFLPGRVLAWSGITRPHTLCAAQVAGLLLVVIGAALALWCIVTFALSGRGTPAPFDPPRRLVVVGPYRLVRNPMYLGAGLTLAGAALFYQSWALLGYCAAFILVMYLFVVVYEEPTLRATFGDAYAQYCSRVRRWWPTFVIAGLLAAAVPADCSAQQVLNIWPGVAPGSEHWTQKERTIENTPLGTVIFNVVSPTLTAYLPARAKASGTGVIIAPGGAFVALTMDLEGVTAARWLQQRGIAAFVLKYRIVEKRQEGIPQLDMDTAGRYGIADGIQALKVVRQRAAEWGLWPDRIGFLGFSAGAMVASGALLQESTAARPSFAALIYGAPFGVMPAIPAKLPPVFLAWAQDDAVALAPVVRFHDALMAAGLKPEVHVYSAGGHGFGLRKQGTSSDHWIDELYFWLAAEGFTRVDQKAHSRNGNR